MTGTALNHLCLLLITWPAMAMLAMAMTRHQQDLLNRTLTPVTNRRLRLTAGLLLGMALLCALRAQGTAQGLVAWTTHLSLSAWLVYLGLIVIIRCRGTHHHRPKSDTRS
ncbi:MAG: DUF3325 family protein [Lautropia sp.]|nr:DUF3325 family protein [Lautropia sp.]